METNEKNNSAALQLLAVNVDESAMKRRGSEAFNQENVSEKQFVSLCESFFYNDVSTETIQEFTQYMRKNYKESDDDRKERIIKLRRAQLMEKRRTLMNNAFESCDDKGSGLLKLAWLDTTMSKCKDSSIKRAFFLAKNEFKAETQLNDSSQVPTADIIVQPASQDQPIKTDPTIPEQELVSATSDDPVEKLVEEYTRIKQFGKKSL
ncbi:EF-hand calcium-binding domain-containing protein 5 [Cichlidogyrus casuarinus]|uniref:EF-hand calcium-binding domain-containing protein 5 n=1 Tax=Cichlidogyrus casuarinus TaxID=1844966 RepID=A0ABD2PNQ7_9PLAT